jgi:hypothetical protein
VSDQFEMIKTKLMGFFAGVTESVLPALEQAGNFIASLDLAPIGKRLGNALQSGLNILVNAFKHGELGNLLNLSIQVGALKGADFIIRSFQGAMGVIGEIIGQTFAILAQPEFWAGMLNGFIAVANQMGVVFMEVMRPAMSWVVGMVNEYITNPMRKMMGKRELTRAEAVEAIYGKGDESLLSDMRKNADEATANAAQAIIDLQQKGILSAEQIKKAFSDQFGKEGFFGEQIRATEAELMALAKRLNIPISEVKKGLASKPGTGVLGAVEKDAKLGVAQKTEAASSLERIGALMGGGGASQALANNTRDTAKFTRLTAEKMDKLIDAVAKDAAWLIPTYGV